MFFRFTKLGWDGADAMEMRHVLSSLPQADVQRWVPNKTPDNFGYFSIQTYVVFAHWNCLKEEAIFK